MNKQHIKMTVNLRTTHARLLLHHYYFVFKAHLGLEIILFSLKEAQIPN